MQLYIPSRWVQLSFSALLAALLCSSQSLSTCLAASHESHKHSPHTHSRSTFLYVVTEPLSGSAINQNRYNINAFRLRRDGSIKSIPLKYDSSAPTRGYYSEVNSLTASPDGKFLTAECQNTHEDKYAPYFIQFRIQDDGQIKPVDRFGLVPGGSGLVFHPSGRYAYLSCPDQSNSQTQPGAIAQYRVTGEGGLAYPPVAFVPCGPRPSVLALDSQGRVGAVLDGQVGSVWQYTLTPQGRLQPAAPPAFAVAKSILYPSLTGDGRFLYAASEMSRQRHRIYQMRRTAGGGYALLMPWAVRLPEGIYSMVISNYRHVLYVSSGTKLLTFRISQQGTLQPAHFSLNTVIGVSLAIDEATGYLCILGLHNTLRAYSISADGTLKALGKAPAHAASWRYGGPTVVHH